MAQSNSENLPRLPVLPTLDDVAKLLFPNPYADISEESLREQNLSDEHIEAMLDAYNEHIADIMREREEWIQSICVRQDELDPQDEGYPETAVLEAIKEAAQLMSHYSDILDSLLALTVKYTDISSRTVESTLSMGHNAVRRRADNGDTAELRALIVQLLRDAAQRYIETADQMEDQS